jgi:hypothetical protein
VSVRDTALPSEISELLRDFIVQQLLHDTYLENATPPFASELSPELAADMDEEFERSIARWLAEGRSTLHSLLADNTAFVNPALAAHYGVLAPATDEFAPVALPPGQGMGLLTHGAFLARYSNFSLRAPHLVEALECVEMPPLSEPTTLWVQPDRPPAKQAIAQNYGDAQETCSVCHRLYVGYGVALDRYDELGRYRETQNSITIDTSGLLYVPGAAPETTTSSAIEFLGPQDLGRALAQAPVVRQCFVKRLVERLGLPALGAEELACVTKAFGARNASLTRLLTILAPRVVSLE